MKIRYVILLLIIVAVISVFVTKAVLEYSYEYDDIDIIDDELEYDEAEYDNELEYDDEIEEKSLEKLSYELPADCTEEELAKGKQYNTKDYVSITVQVDNYSVGREENVLNLEIKTLSEIGAVNPVIEKKTINGKEWSYIDYINSNKEGDFGYDIKRDRYYAFYDGKYYMVYISYMVDIDGAEETAENIVDSLKFNK